MKDVQFVRVPENIGFSDKCGVCCKNPLNYKSVYFTVLRAFFDVILRLTSSKSLAHELRVPCYPDTCCCTRTYHFLGQVGYFAVQQRRASQLDRNVGRAHVNDGLGSRRRRCRSGGSDFHRRSLVLDRNRWIGHVQVELVFYNKEKKKKNDK